MFERDQGTSAVSHCCWAWSGQDLPQRIRAFALPQQHPENIKSHADPDRPAAKTWAPTQTCWQSWKACAGSTATLASWTGCGASMHRLVPRATDPGRAASVVSPALRDGMNLVAKEFIAARQLKRAGAGSVPITAEQLLPR
jgi:hypothetical protein